MPVIAAVVGAVMTGLVYWFMYGHGMETIDALLRNKRDGKRRAAAVEQQRLAPLRSIKDPREAAIALMDAVAGVRGVVTPEQLACIRTQMEEVLGYGAGDDGEARLAFAQHAIAQGGSPDIAVDILAPLLRDKLDRGEREELRTCLERVAVLHGGPTDEQSRIIDRTMRRLAEAA